MKIKNKIVLQIKRKKTISRLKIKRKTFKFNVFDSELVRLIHPTSSATEQVISNRGRETSIYLMISHRRQFHLKVWPFSEDSTFSNLIAFSMSPLMLQTALQKAISFISVNFNFKTNSFSLTLFSNSSIIFVN